MCVIKKGTEHYGCMGRGHIESKRLLIVRKTCLNLTCAPDVLFPNDVACFNMTEKPFYLIA